MELFVWLIAVAILGLAAVAASGRLGELPATVTDTPTPHVPAGDLTAADLRALRFAVVPRGYSMQQVDEVLERIAGQLDREPGHRPAELSAAWPAASATAPAARSATPSDGPSATPLADPSATTSAAQPAAPADTRPADQSDVQPG